MNRGRRNFDPPVGLTASPLEPQAVRPPRANRLSRSSRLTQASPAEVDSPRSQRADFKTPTRISRSKSAAVSSEESPHADADFQQDIIWDATSPSPRRLCKRGRKPLSGVVSISEIVSKIAPKHGRPRVPEPTLQQWIGDSATIPCTPDVKAPRAKKSPRPSRVDDLLRLAKQFDFNMFHRDEEEEHQQNLEGQSQDIPEETVKRRSSLPPENYEAAVSTAAGSSMEPDQNLNQDLDLDQHLGHDLEDDLDFLFDGPTQHVSRNLSQPSQVKPLTLPSPAVSMVTCKPSHTDEFEDDWENDDLLNDSVVMEMTQNPQNFMVPKLCSTQKLASQSGQGKMTGPVIAAVQVSHRTRSRPEKDVVSPRASFKLLSGSDFSERRIRTDTKTIQFPAETGPQQTRQTCQSNTVLPEPLRPGLDDSLNKPAAVPSCSDLLDDDLDSFFSSDPVWDDLADDDLLCEMCEDLENQIQGLNNSSTRPTPGSSNQRSVLQPTHRTCDNRMQPAGGLVAVVNAVEGPIRFTETASRCLKTSSHTAAAVPLPLEQAKTHNFTFKKPSNPVSMATNKAAGKCSAAEIEMKKQQAMERRRQRLQAAQHTRALT